MNSTYILSIGIVSALFLLLVWSKSSRRQQERKVVRSPLHSNESVTGMAGASTHIAWISENRLETRLEALKNKEISKHGVIGVLLASDIYVRCESGGDLFDVRSCEMRSGPRGSKMIPVFSSFSRLKMYSRARAGSFTKIETIKLRDQVRAIPNNIGFILNPGIEYSVELLPDEVNQIKLELS